MKKLVSMALAFFLVMSVLSIPVVADENNDDAVMNPNELNAGFAGKKWAYDGTNEKVVIEGTTFQGATGNTKMMQLRYNAATTETLSTVADDDCTISLTLTPEDGFSFVPSKVSFLAGKFTPVIPTSPSP